MNLPATDLLIASAKEHHAAGRIDLAAQLYSQILAFDPRHAQAHVLLGLIALHRACDTEAVDYFRKSIALDSKIPDAHLYLGIALRNLNHFEPAIVAMKQALAINPNYSQAYSEMGLIALRLGRESEAAEAYEKCLQLDPNSLEANNNLGNIRKAQRRIAEAAHLYHRALSLDPTNPDLKFNLSQALQDMDRFEISIPLLKEAISQKPNEAEWHLQLAHAFVATNQRSEAIQACETALLLAPRFPEGLYLRGNLYGQDADYSSAQKYFKRAIEVRPDFASAMANLGAAYQNQGKFDEAHQWYQQALSIDPGSVSVLYNLGMLFYCQGKFETALAYFKRMLASDPDNIDGLLYFGLASEMTAQLDQAAQAFERIVFLQPNHTAALHSLGDTYREQQHHDWALVAFQRALATSPESPHLILRCINQKQGICEWDGLDDQAVKFLSTIEKSEPCQTDEQVSPFMVIGLSKPATPNQQFIQTKKYVRSRVAQVHPIHFKHKLDDCSDAPERRIRIGYFSGDFQVHPVGYLVPELFESHDRSRFEVYGYSYGPEDNSSIRKRIIGSLDKYRDVRTGSFEAMADKIADDRIDILIDLQGFTIRNRADVLLRRPAPIQVTYLGYAGTLAMDCVDYILVDDYVAPLDQQPYHTEELVHIPGCFMVNDSRREIDPAIPVRHYMGLPEDGFVFCAFNTNYKMTRTMFELWMRLLHAVPGSVLWLRDSNRFAVENLKKEAARCGIGVERLVMAPSMPMPKHLARHRAADLFLDTFPYNQHSTAADALRMGLPMVTLSGETFASRVAGSVLRTLGLSELIATDFEQYEKIALKLALDRNYRTDVRRRLKQSLATTDLYDGRAFARKVEAAYEKMWQRFCQKQRSGLA
jgi:protein O-GlcNAc transferase